MFPFKLFWRMMPFAYLFFFVLSNHPNFFLLGIGLVLICSLSFYKVRQDSKIFAVIEYIFLFAYALLIPNYVLIWLMVPLIDWCWRDHHKHFGRWGPIFFAFSTSLFVFYFYLNLLDLTKYSFGFLSIIWIASELQSLESKKKRAQSYYDQLRYSEEALKRANEELQAYYETLEEVAVLRERTRISREIHDHVGHALATTLIQLQALSVRLSKDSSPSLAQVNLLTEIVRNTLSDTRSVVHNMAPSIKGFQMLKSELSTLCQNVQEMTGAQVILTFTQDDYPLMDYQAMAIFRIIQEALTNSVKHGQAKQVKVVLSASPKQVLLTITDDGIGAEAVTEHFGLSHMRDRVNQLKGKIAFETRPKMGFTIKISIPKGDSL